MIDLMLISSTEDIDENQEFFEKKYEMYSNISNLKRLEYEKEIDDWDAFIMEERRNERNKVSNRQAAINRISRILQEVPSNSKKSSISEAEIKE